MRICTKCKKQNTTKNQSWCSACKKEYDKQYYQNPENKERHKARTKYNQSQITKWYNTIKNKPCADCKNTFHFAAMQWDHLPEYKKAGNVAQILSYGNKEKIINEIAKCEIVCANCHAVRTYNRKQASLV